jgi:hypothetical protein
MGEVPHLAAEAVDQDNGAPHAFVEHMEAFAVEVEKAALRCRSP